MLANKSNNWAPKSKRVRLLEELKKYKGLIANNLYDYLNSIINLEFSALGKEIGDREREALTRLCFDLYRSASIYNIYNRTMQLFEQDADKLKISSLIDHSHKEKIYIDKSQFNLPEKEYNYYDEQVEHDIQTLFEFDFKPQSGGIDLRRFLRTQSRLNSVIPSPHIGNISMSQVQVVEGQNEKVAASLRNRAEELRKRLYPTNTSKNPVAKRKEYDEDGYPVLGNCNSDFLETQHMISEKLRAYEDRINELLSKDGLNDYEKCVIELTQKYHELLCKEFELKDTDFRPDGNYLEERRLLIRKPNFSIHDTIHFIE